ncbi:unnamed protein product [Rotaria sp. Silwood2]|nr:unnamed protein product [Rotaria sp. Silwood2]CAF4098585.1 unnamed protein product [Rotaria sp. Silwood2]
MEIGLVNNYPNIFYRSNIRYVSIDLHPSLYRFLEQLNGLFPDVFCIKVDTDEFRTDFNPCLFGLLVTRWNLFLQTPVSINQLVNIFEQDLCQLIKQLKEFIFLDIHSEIDQENVEPYHSIIRAHFSNN